MTYAPETWREGIEKAMEDALATHPLILEAMVYGKPVDLSAMPREEVFGFLADWMRGMQGVVRLMADKLDQAEIPFVSDDLEGDSLGGSN
jgi:hypothetical protein